MKKKYYFHPSSYSLSEIEEFYEKKAENGLLLEKRGNYLSKFRKEEPKNLSYRVEVIDYDKLNEHKIPEEQVAIYEECGWTHVCGHRHIQIFSADKSTDPPELYYQPEDQIESIKILSKTDFMAFISMLTSWSLFLFINFQVFSGGSFSQFLKNVGSLYFRFLMEKPPLAILYVLILVNGIGRYLFGISSSQYYISRLKKGIPLRKIKPYGKELKPFKKGATMVVLIGLLLMSAPEILTYEKREDPSEAAGPYVTLSDFDVKKAPPDENSILGEDYYRKKKTIWGEIIKTQESSNQFYKDITFIQEVYEIKNDKLRGMLVEVLINESLLGKYDEDYVERSVAGLDEVYVKNSYDMVVVKDELVLNITTFSENQLSQEEFLHKLSEILNSKERSFGKS
ncbi:DUF2812 domain-containing protein [Proteiniclasticum ruminis]|uniref:DUF2812 domain-containing protein n=1 Tax=Proteiniclasticum ruminis TaxID=398199 RepID=A0A1I5DHS0_9CLOT|nr:DUF2812 domain-containing protein [Proteiniclasticum ruminis]SFN98710.1 Protein of unknown function [Proteiniclasticum ruminis]